MPPLIITKVNLDLVRVEHSLRDPEGAAGGAGQDRHGELHRQAGGRKSGTGKGGKSMT